MTEYDDDLRHARNFLLLDDREMQNVYAEHRKREAQRKAAIEYGDKGSNVEPVTFIAPSCKECMDPIVYANTSPDKETCLWCYRGKQDKPERKRIAWGDVVFWLTVGVAVIGLVAYAVMP